METNTPLTPNIGDSYTTDNGETWTFNGQHWEHNEMDHVTISSTDEPDVDNLNVEKIFWYHTLDNVTKEYNRNTQTWIDII
jgi:hypothetical protein